MLKRVTSYTSGNDIDGMTVVARRVLTYQGFHTIELNRDEITCESLLILCEVLEWPDPRFVNEEYWPDRGVYARVTGSFFAQSSFFEDDEFRPLQPEFVEKDFLIRYPQQLIYKGYNTDALIGKIGGAILAGQQPTIADQIAVAPIDWRTAMRYVASVFVRAAVPEDEPLTFPRPWGHSPTVYRVDCPDNAKFRWTIVATCSQAGLDNTRDIPPPGSENPGDGIPIADPPNGPLEKDVPLTPPPGGSLPENFFQEVPDGPTEFPFGESGRNYLVTWTETWSIGGLSNVVGEFVPEGTYEYTIQAQAGPLPGPIAGVEPEVGFVGGGGSLRPGGRGLSENGTGQDGVVVSFSTTSGLTSSQLITYSNRRWTVSGVTVTEV